jgi:hypothetical protein
MVARAWIGGGNNQASNPKDWSPTGVPQVGDTLFVMEGAATYTMNVSGDDLVGDTLTVERAEPPYALTANLSHHAIMNVEVGYGGTGTFNLSQGSTLNLRAD